VAACIVSYRDIEGLRHTVEVQAESLFEAAILAMRIFRQHGCEPTDVSQIDVEIRSSVTHTVTLKKVHHWLNVGARSPKEALLKQRLKEML
jgi:hypothetical protein